MSVGLFRAHRREEDAGVASYRRKVEKMRPPAVTSRHHPKSKPAPTPHTCRRECQPGYTCTSTVRGGVCPCSDC